MAYSKQTFSPNEKLAAAKMNKISDNIEALRNGELVDGSIALSKLSSSVAPVQFFSASANTITVQAPFNCVADVEWSGWNWGWDGVHLEHQINGVGVGLTKKYNHKSVVEGGNSVKKLLNAKAGFVGLQAGQSYTFTAAVVTGREGRETGDPSMSVRLFRV